MDYLSRYHLGIPKMPLKDRYNSRSRNRRSRSRSQIEKEKPSILGTRSSQVHDEGERKTYDYSEVSMSIIS